MNTRFPRPMRASLGRRARLVLALLVAAAAFAQYQVGTQLSTPLYGGGSGTVRYGMSAMPNLPFYQASLASDRRHDYELSGQLRSDVRGSYLLQGPMAPGGYRTYLASSPPTPTGVPRPYAATPSYYSSPVPPRPVLGMSVGGTAPSGSMRYGGVTPGVTLPGVSSYAPRTGVPMPTLGARFPTARYGY